jgi:Protein of unknown function (DUF2799)
MLRATLRRTLPATALLIALATSGCSTMSKSECLAVDWRTVGYEDGVAGYSGDRIAQHRKACAKYGVQTDLTQYQAGRDQGLHEYCKPANGYRLGARGGSYGGVCPVELEGGFVSAFEVGHQLYTLGARVSEAKSQLAAKRRELERVEQGIAENAAAALSSDTSKEERKDAVVDTAELAERAGRLKAEIRQLEHDTVRYEHEYEEYRASQPPIV